MMQVLHGHQGGIGLLQFGQELPATAGAGEQQEGSQPGCQLATVGASFHNVKLYSCPPGQLLAGRWKRRRVVATQAKAGSVVAAASTASTASTASQEGRFWYLLLAGGQHIHRVPYVGA